MNNQENLKEVSKEDLVSANRELQLKINQKKQEVESYTKSYADARRAYRNIIVVICIGIVLILLLSVLLWDQFSLLTLFGLISTVISTLLLSRFLCWLKQSVSLSKQRVENVEIALNSLETRARRIQTELLFRLSPKS